VTVVEHHLAAVAGAHGGRGDLAVSGGVHRRAVWVVDVDAGVEGAFPINGILALAEA
jgi:hypothetical protein